jgi:hypothetical protein
MRVVLDFWSAATGPTALTLDAIGTVTNQIFRRFETRPSGVHFHIVSFPSELCTNEGAGDVARARNSSRQIWQFRLREDMRKHAPSMCMKSSAPNMRMISRRVSVAFRGRLDEIRHVAS